MNNEQPIICCAHDGLFHSDDVMACAALRLAAGSSYVSIMRSRLPRDFERADFVLDVGGKYDGVKWFDHHQPESTGKRKDGTGFSCFGLLWEKFGSTIVREVLACRKLEDSMIVKVLADMEDFVKGIDLHDQAQLNVLARWSLNKAIHVEVATLQSIISGMNSIPFIDEKDAATVNDKFYKAVDFAEDFLARLIERKASKVMATKFVETRIKPDNALLFLEDYCDYYDAVSKAPHIKYVIYPSSNGKAMVAQAVKAGSGPNTLKNLRLPFPVDWAGLQDAELAKVSSVPDALFCHRDRFIASASTLAGAVALAEQSISLQDQNPLKL